MTIDNCGCCRVRNRRGGCCPRGRINRGHANAIGRSYNSGVRRQDSSSSSSRGRGFNHTNEPKTENFVYNNSNNSSSKPQMDKKANNSNSSNSTNKTNKNTNTNENATNEGNATTNNSKGTMSVKVEEVALTRINSEQIESRAP